jgi:hypothetical protein
LRDKASCGEIERGLRVEADETFGCYAERSEEQTRSNSFACFDYREKARLEIVELQVKTAMLDKVVRWWIEKEIGEIGER